MDPKDRKYLGENNIIPSVQPTHATSDMYWAEARLGKDRMQNAYAYKSLRDDANGMIAFGTDFPVEDISPIKTFYAAVYRRDLNNFPAEGFQMEERTKRKDALRAMTIWAAYANFEDEEKGSLEEGKFADLVILDQDILKMEEKDIPKTKVIATYVNGEKVFGN
jgi:predicted amidohydrolase YtcJ